MDPAWVVATVALSTAVLGLLTWLVRALWKLFRKTDGFLNDWNGHPKSPGHIRTPGVMERLEALETRMQENVGRLDAQDAVLRTIKDEVTFNDGHSMKDAVREILSRTPPQAGGTSR